MRNEVLPVGTEGLLRRLGYCLTASRGAWLPAGVSLPEDIVMTADQVRYRRYQAIMIKRFGNSFFERRGS